MQPLHLLPADTKSSGALRVYSPIPHHPLPGAPFRPRSPAHPSTPFEASSNGRFEYPFPSSPYTSSSASTSSSTLSTSPISTRQPQTPASTSEHSFPLLVSTSLFPSLPSLPVLSLSIPKFPSFSHAPAVIPAIASSRPHPRPHSHPLSHDQTHSYEQPHAHAHMHAHASSVSATAVPGTRRAVPTPEHEPPVPPALSARWRRGRATIIADREARASIHRASGRSSGARGATTGRQPDRAM
ncbi:hypothetical protein HETIRDRAFT_458873 [Heterobasidion irregulare TC 32-1]|uniref:Uncharacterized protein n=1 Tax=Heterobasidion irregulare (strain TC 32-1) TaxID=747525 RepID=W4K6M9_HETIT|nr:uncharacterized protein HETIRDRAFT_458873 [Heterobasidion irregulare TC 32-1]ETW81487.1 hypothetical protein HETIRDRAFT_458873 [Heterobasidion irregulare TC 32-1]